jgi:hypothetical protein
LCGRAAGAHGRTAALSRRVGLHSGNVEVEDDGRWVAGAGGGPLRLEEAIVHALAVCQQFDSVVAWLHP